MNRVDEGSLRREEDLRFLARGGLFTLGGIAANGVLQFAIVVVLTRSLGAAGAGALFVAIAVFTLLANVAEFGADTGLVRSVPAQLAEGRTATLSQLLAVALVPTVTAGVALGLGLALLAPALGRLLMGSDVATGVTYLRLLAIFLPFAVVSTVVLAGTRGFGTMVPFVAVEYVGKPALRLLCLSIVLAAGAHAAGIALGWGAPIVVGAGVALVWWTTLLGRTDGRGRSGVEPWRRTASRFWRFAAPRGVAAIFQTASVWIGIPLVAALSSARESGIFGAVNRLVIFGTFALNAVNLVLGPQVSALFARRERDRAEAVYRTGVLWLIVFSCPLYLTLAVFAPLALRVFGPGFEGGQSALVILCLGMLVNMATGNSHIVLLMGGRSGWNLANTIVAVTLNVGLGLLLIPSHGATGAAIAWAAAIVVDNVATLVEVRLFLGLHPFESLHLVAGGIVVGVFGGFGLLARWWLGVTAPAFLVFALVASFAYGTFLWRYREPLELGVLRDALPGHRGRRTATGRAG